MSLAMGGVDRGTSSSVGQNASPATSTDDAWQVSLDEDPMPAFLPDDIVLMVFSYLTVQQLLAVRRVCRRWAALALHADAWRERDISLGGYTRTRATKATRTSRATRATLRLAPCARRLRLDAKFLNDDAVQLATTTLCAVGWLSIMSDERSAGVAARVLSHQASLGRLRKLEVRLFGYTHRLKEQSRALLSTAYATEGLRELCLVVGSEHKCSPDWMPPVGKPVRTSLKTLRFTFIDPSWCRVLERLVEWHAPTLTTLAVNDDDIVGEVSQPPTLSAQCLAGAAQLRALDCPLFAGMADVISGCAGLESLVLKLDKDLRLDDALVRGAAQFLRGATQLRRLSMVVWQCETVDEDEELQSLGLHLLRALSSGGGSALESLTIQLLQHWKKSHVDDLLAAIRGLSNLHDLQLPYLDLDDLHRLMDGMTIAPVAGLGTLRVELLDDSGCLHKWLHRKAGRVEKLLAQHPRLHLDFFGDGWFCCGKCASCVVGCHGSAGSKDLPRLVLFGHPEGGPCDVALHADPGVTPLRIARQSER